MVGGAGCIPDIQGYRRSIGFDRVDFPAEHWDHLRTVNPVKSVFAKVRHRTVHSKGALSHKTAKLDTSIYETCARVA